MSRCSFRSAAAAKSRIALKTLKFAVFGLYVVEFLDGAPGFVGETNADNEGKPEAGPGSAAVPRLAM